MLAAAMCLVSFAWSFVYVALPFHIVRISRVGPAATLAWTGWILGITSLASVVTGPLWSRLVDRGDPKRACVLVQLFQGLGFLGTGLARSLLELFLARLALGIAGSASTIAFIIVSRTSDPGEMRRRVAAVQSALLIGQVVGPLPGAVAAARLGFRATFALGGAVLLACAGLLQWRLPRPPAAAAAAVARRGMPMREVALAATVVLVASVQEAFLTAVLPGVLPGLGVAADDLVEAGGMLVFVSGVAAAAGGLAAPHLADQVAERRLVPLLLLGSSALLALFGVTGSLWGFTVLRAVQSVVVAPLFPVVVARVARRGGGEAIGVVNAARVGSGFVASVAATSVLAWAPPAVLYVALAAAGVGAVLVARR
jgi:DHA1 family multidrug resistance protein-like MFS transporter